MERLKVYRMGPKDFHKCTEKDLKNIIEWLEASEVGDKFEIDILEMTRDEYDNLPEYMGP